MNRLGLRAQRANDKCCPLMTDKQADKAADASEEDNDDPAADPADDDDLGH